MKYNAKKDLNEEYHLNDVSLKSRYKLMKLNKINEKEGYERGVHWNKNKPYPLIDEDIKYNQYIQHYSSVNHINKDNSELFSIINKSGIKKKLNNMKQSSVINKSIMSLKKICSYNSDKNINDISKLDSNKKKKYFNVFTKNSLSSQYRESISSLRNINEIKSNGFNFIYKRNKNINDKISIFPSLTEKNIHLYNKYKQLLNDEESILNKEKSLNDFSNEKKDKNINLIKSKNRKLTNEKNKVINSYSNRSRNKNKSQKLLLNKNLTISPFKSYRLNNNNKITQWKFLDEIPDNKSAFPKHLYFHNYSYENGIEGIKNNQNKMDEIQRIISLKFNQIKGFINESIDKTPKNYG